MKDCLFRAMMVAGIIPAIAAISVVLIVITTLALVGRMLVQRGEPA